MHYPLFWNIGYPGQLVRRSQQSNVCPEQGIPGRAALSRNLMKRIQGARADRGLQGVRPTYAAALAIGN